MLTELSAFSPDCKIHLSFDIDALDPEFAPSTGTAVPGGLSLEEGRYICRTLAQTGKCAAHTHPQLVLIDTPLSQGHCARSLV